MKNVIKSYYPFLVSILFMYIYSFLLKASFDGFQPETTYGIILVIVTFLLVIAIFAEIIGFIIHAAKNKELKNKVLWCFLIYFFNLFIIPYYNLKYVVNSDKVKLKIVIYILLMICSLLFGISSSHVEEKNLYLKSDDNKIQLELKGDYVQRDVGQYDLYASDFYRGINMGVFIYTDDFGYNIDEIQSFMENSIQNTRDNVQLISRYDEELDDRKIISKIISGNYEGEKYIYKISTVDFLEAEYFLNTIQVSFYEDYNDELEKEFNDMLINAKYIEE